jgi:hypothetical protein
MKPIIIACKCGTRSVQKVRKFGVWVVPDSGQMSAIKSGTYKRQYEKCVSCLSA